MIKLSIKTLAVALLAPLVLLFIVPLAIVSAASGASSSILNGYYSNHKKY